MSNFDLVRRFHQAFGLLMNSRPAYWRVSRRDIDLRMRLIEEETREVVDALYKGDTAHIAKELADLLYVTYGTGVALGLDLDKAFKLVHESNMSKLGADGKPIFREDGKILKGPDYFNPDMSNFGEDKMGDQQQQAVDSIQVPVATEAEVADINAAAEDVEVLENQVANEEAQENDGQADAEVSADVDSTEESA